MLFIWVACGVTVVTAGAAALWRPRWMVPASIAGGLVVAAVTAAQPTLFRAENGFALTFLVFGLATTVVALPAVALVQAVVREVVGRRTAAARPSVRRPPNDR